ncbi:serum response factor-binding protein 1-like [Daktulosphaira vitifoliae]|uniref:serum response factor-binding protein 1-like n=1 Tax=Daktulosphaira vitifoliae TaxID=58002 RepID=UPI0021A994AF|nr:serum response factor-binding protein 1-like [Daktulosphaira vitifoliae]
MESLTKFSLNNQIVLMRHIVRKSRVHLIHKLTRESKKLKGKKGTDEQIDKNKKKSERLVNEILYIKKLNDDEVSKYALLNETPVADILNNVETTLEHRALARLSGHKFIDNSIKIFRDKYLDWKSTLRDLLNDLGARHKLKKKPNQKSKNSNNVTRENCVNKKEEKTIIHDVCNKINNLEENEVNTDTIKKLTNSLIKEDKITEKVESTETCTDSIVSDNLSKISSNSDSDCARGDDNQQSNKSKTNTSVVSNLDLLVEVPRSIIKNSNKNVQINKANKRKTNFETNKHIVPEKKRNIEEIEPVCQSVDSFFMTTDDKEYKSVYKPPPLKEKSFDEPSKVEYKISAKEVFIKGKKIVVNKQNAFANRRERRNPVDHIENVLHPSWEAKRKQKSLAKFEGKKIVFDDQD